MKFRKNPVPVKTQKKRKWIIMSIVLLIIFSTPFVIKAVKYFNSWEYYYKTHPNELLTNGMPSLIEDKEKQENEWKNTISDIEGLTKYEKHELGLKVVDGSDTDEDGLTDKEEIEIYHSDPLKPSSADDMWFDGEKVEMGLDPNEYLEEPDELYFKYLELDDERKAEKKNIKLIPNTVIDRKAYFEIRHVETYNGESVYKEYKLWDFSGKIELMNVDTNNYNVYVVEYEFAKKEYKNKYKLEDLKIVLENDFDSELNYLIIITEKSNVSINSIINENDTSKSETLSVLIYGSPLLSAFGGKYRVLYSNENFTESVQFRVKGLITKIS